MLKTNDPAHKGEAVVCLLAGDNDGLSSSIIRLQRLSRFGLFGRRAALIAALAWEVRHG